jgi:16S rRNA (guanine966-N2)-methyltransferase
VTRIIAGTIGSLRLKGAAHATRPTSDRVKESIFSKLESLGLIEDANALDLFAGTGSLGLEAASRGAREVLFIEKDKPAFELLKANIAHAAKALDNQGLSGILQARNIEASQSLKNLPKSFFDLVFIDPPYDFSNQKLEEVLNKLSPALKDGAALLIERSSKTEQFAIQQGYELMEIKDYGDTSVAFLEFTI